MCKHTSPDTAVHLWLFLIDDKQFRAFGENTSLMCSSVLKSYCKVCSHGSPMDVPAPWKMPQMQSERTAHPLSTRVSPMAVPKLAMHCENCTSDIRL